MKYLAFFFELVGFGIVMVVMWSVLWISRAKAYGGIDQFLQSQPTKPYLLNVVRFFDGHLIILGIVTLTAVILLTVGRAISQTSLRIHF